MRTLIKIVGVAALVAPVFAQQGPDASAQLQRAQLIEQQEGDLRAAEAEYRRLATAGGDAAVAAGASLRLGKLLVRLQRDDEARPFLERARDHGGDVGNEAQLVLQGQDPAGKQSQELAARVARAVDRVVAGEASTDGQLRKELQWLGEAVVAEIGRRLGAVREIAIAQLHAEGAVDVLNFARSVYAGPASEARTACFCLVHLLQTGGKAAGLLLEEQLRVSAPEWRRLVALATRGEGVADGAAPVVAQLLRDEDPTGAVQQLAIRAALKLPFEHYAPLLQSPHANVRIAAWQSLMQHSLFAGTDGSHSAAAAVGGVLTQCDAALQGSDPDVARSAFQFLCMFAGCSEAAGTLFLSWLPRVPAYDGGSQQQVQAPLAQLLACAKQLGAANMADGHNGRRRTVVGNLLRTAKNGDVARLLDVFELGYGELDGGPGLDSLLQFEPTEDDLVRIAAMLGRQKRTQEVVEELAKRDLPAAAAAPLLRRLDELLTIWKAAADPRIPLPPDQQAAANEVGDVFKAIGRTGSAAALPRLREIVQQREDARGRAVSAILAIASRNAEPAVSATLRDLLVDGQIEDQRRNEVFGALVKRADAAAIPLFAKAYALGLRSTAQVDVVTSGGVHTREALLGVGWFRAKLPPAYDDGQRLAIWQSLLASESWLEALLDLKDESSLAVHTAVMRALVQRRADLDGKLRGEGVHNVWQWLRELLEVQARMLPTDDGAMARDYRAAFAAMLRAGELGWWAAGGLRYPAATRLVADSLVAMLHTTWAYNAYGALRNAGIEVSAADTVAGIQNSFENQIEGSFSLQGYLSSLPRDVGPEVVAAVEALAKSSDHGVRQCVCATLGRMLMASSAPTLLQLLRDNVPAVREAATAALQQIRLYHEQKAFWDQFQTGISTSREAAAAKLLAQAKPDQPKAQRLLAVQSLGVLGAPEALPYLIEWTQDGDAEIVAAVRAAIGKLQNAAAK